MPETVTLKVITNNKPEDIAQVKNVKSFTLNVENSKYINSVVNVGENNTITPEQMKQLQNIAARSGDLGVLELCDLTPAEKINLAKINGYSEYYNIKISKDGKYYQVEIKETGTWTKDPNLGTIKKDFGVRDGVFVQGHEIPYGNEDLIYNREKGRTADERNIDYDKTKLKPGDVINIPVSEVTIQDSPRGKWGRFWQ